MSELEPDNTNKVDYYSDLYRSYARRSKKLMDRMDRNWGMYSGVDYGQWDPDQVQQMIEERRAPHQVNFIQNQVNSLLGNAINDELETSFLPASGTPNDKSIALNSIYLADKDRSNWDKEIRKFFRAGIVLRGVGEIYMNYKVDNMGSISFRSRNPKRFIFDPDWDTDDINDNDAIIEYVWMNPKEIQDVYNKKSPEISEAIKMWKLVRSSQTDEIEQSVRDNFRHADNPEYVNISQNRFLVIQVTQLQKVHREKLYDLENQKYLPDMSPENSKMMMALKGDKLKVIQDKYAIVKVVTIAPGLSRNLVLDDGNHPIQIGRYPYFKFSYMNVDGVDQGVVDVLADLQQIFNKRESAFTHWQSTASNGSEFIEETFFVNDTEYEKYVNNGNVPGGKYKVRDGTISNGRMGIASKPRDGQPQDLLVSADRAFNMVAHVSPNVQALTGGEGKSGESGKLFAQKRQQALVSLTPLQKSIEDFWHEFAEAYFYLAKQKYSGSPRKIVNPKTKQATFLNIPTSSGEIINDFSDLERHNVYISKSKRGVNTREELLNRFVELMPFFQNPMLRSQLEKAAIQVLPNIPDAEIELALDAANKFSDLQESRVNVEKMQNDLGIFQMMQQVKQMQQPQQPMIPGQESAALGPTANPPGQGGGLSPEGKNLKPSESIPADVRTINQLNK